MAEYGELKPTMRVLMGPGPSNVHPRVLKAMSTPLIGHLDPEFLKIMDDVQELLRYVFQTKNHFTIPVSGTGSAGMETCLVNLIEDGDEVVVGVNGVFGERMSDIVSRCGGKLTRVDAEWGRIIPSEKIAEAVKGTSGVKLVAVVHAETSTGAWQPLEEIARIAHEAGALFLADTVTSLGGCPVKLDEWGIDVCYSGTQKCLSCPPGLSPVSFNERARQVITSRKKKDQSWYLDMTMVEKYWGKERTYHHTAPITMVYGLREALRLIYEEGLENRFKRHELNHNALKEGLKALGISLFAQEGHRLWMLNTVKVPEGIDEARVRKRLLDEFNIEIGGGLGVVKGKIWRVGLMGYSSSKENVLYFLSALEKILGDEGYRFEPGLGVASASRVFANI